MLKKLIITASCIIALIGCGTDETDINKTTNTNNEVKTEATEEDGDNNNVENEVEEVACTVESLENHDFEQLSNIKEYACVNKKDSNDILVITEEYESLEEGDNLKLQLNKYGDMITYDLQ